MEEILVSELLLWSLLLRYKRHHYVLISCSIRLICIRWSPSAIAPRCHGLVALQVYVEQGDGNCVNSEVPLGRYLVKDCGKPGLFVSPPCGISLVVTFCIVPLPLLGAVNVCEGSTSSTADPFWPLNWKVGLTHSHEELVIFETPSPVLVAHPIHLVIVLARNEQNAPNKSWVVIFWVQLWGGDVQGALLRKTIKQLWIFREEIHVVHCDVVAALAGLFEADIDEGGSVEPPVISLIDDPDLMLHPLGVQEAGDVRRKLHQLLIPVLEWNDKAELVAREAFQFAGSCHWSHWRVLLLFRTIARLRSPAVKVQGCHHHQTQAYQDTYQHSPHLALMEIHLG